MPRRRRPQPSRYDPTFGDRGLVDARQDLVVGRWQGARDLLAATGSDWDRRSHRVRLLADVAAGNRTVETWQSGEPKNPDALVVRADTEVMRLFTALARQREDGAEGPRPDTSADQLDRALLDRAARICLQAAEAAPADPMPWVSLMTLSRLYGGGHQHTWHWWRELTARDPYHREGHHQALRHLSARWHGSHGEMYNFAHDTAAFAPLGSPLPALTQAARVEHYVHRVATEGRAAIGLTYHWSHDSARQALRTTLNRWITHRAPVEHAQDVADLNLLVHGLVHAGMIPEAVEVFPLLGDRPTRYPWAHTGDPEALFNHWRTQLLA
ncbi:hypothetical protein [Phaeacidiphilus oryzae]|uniref:hypothetical protein n=1 Tax=Phaeacidiphilus oryzae TaxID=348818 RepID=UPI000566DE67|nr:hypothetical protein [Phaeacidiphilus oryzae]